MSRCVTFSNGSLSVDCFNEILQDSVSVTHLFILYGSLLSSYLVFVCIMQLRRRRRREAFASIPRDKMRIGREELTRRAFGTVLESVATAVESARDPPHSNDGDPGWSKQHPPTRHRDRIAALTGPIESEVLLVDPSLYFPVHLTFREYLARVASRLPALPWALCDACANVYELARFSHHNLRRAHVSEAQALFARLAEEIRRAHLLADSAHTKRGSTAGAGDATWQGGDAGSKGPPRWPSHDGQTAEEKGGPGEGAGLAARARAAFGSLPRMRRPTGVYNLVQRVRKASD